MKPEGDRVVTGGNVVEMRMARRVIVVMVSGSLYASPMGGRNRSEVEDVAPHGAKGKICMSR